MGCVGQLAFPDVRLAGPNQIRSSILAMQASVRVRRTSPGEQILVWRPLPNRCDLVPSVFDAPSGRLKGV
jgi:hypothetical protein